MRVRSWPTAACSMICVLAALTLLAGCRDDGPGDASGEMSTPAGPVRGGTAVISLPSEPDVLNSLIRTSAVAGQVLSLLQAGLAEMAEDLTWSPEIAASWDVAPDSLAITYHLRPWRWADGAPLQARDVVASFALLTDPRIGSPRAGLYEAVTGVTALDSATVRYTFSQPQAHPVERSVHAILPWHAIHDLDPVDVRSWHLNQHPLASGPFRLASWEHNRQLVLVPNEHYPLGRPYLDRVVLRILPDETSRVLALETGATDVMTDVPPGMAERLTATGKITIHEISGRAFGFLLWNLRRPELRDVRVRRALSLAIDRRRLIEAAFAGHAQPAASFLPPALWNHHADLAPDPHDPETARALLDAAGWRDRDGDGWRDRDGRRLQLEVLYKGGDPVRENGAVVVRENLQDVGVEIVPRGMEMAAGVARLRAGEFDAYLGEFNANLYADPSPLVRSDAQDRANFGGYANATVDSLLRAALRIADRDRALPVWRRVQEELAADPPAAVLYYPQDLVGVSDRIHDVRPHMLSPFNNLAEWWIAPGDRLYRTDK